MNIFAFFKKICPARLSSLILHVGCTVVILYLFSMVALLSFAELPSYILAHIYSPALEHILMCAAITFVGALLAELASLEDSDVI